ncbi:MAG TPA: hypothetical protein P5181_14250 [Dermatophilaceae bacterium]|nr:hypothetical protein [Dermatophilaceae bacterium]
MADRAEDWSGTSDGSAAVAARAAMTPAQRLTWLEGALELARASGALDRRRRQADAAACREWAAGPAAAAPGR